MFLCSTAVSVCGLAAIGTVTSEFPNGWFLPFQENLSKMMKEVEEAKHLERQKHVNLLVHLLILFDLRSLNCLYYHFYFLYLIIYFAFLLLKTFFKFAAHKLLCYVYFFWTFRCPHVSLLNVFARSLNSLTLSGLYICLSFFRGAWSLY